MDLEIQQLQMTYPGGKQAIKHLDLKLTPGIYGLLGANGAGKTTLMNILTRNLKQTKGKILFDGEDIEKAPVAYVEQIGYMPQQQGLYKEMTALQFLAYMANLKGLSKKEAKEQIPELLKKVNLESEGRKRLGTFSGGMKQRILIAQAMLGNPKLMIFDEPTAGLDPKERVRVRNLISELSFDKIVIIATHVVTDVEFISKELLVMKKGELIREGSPSDLLTELDGLVYQVEIPMKEYKRLNHLLLVSNIQRDGNHVIMRVVGSPAEIKEVLEEDYSMQEKKPELDDLYLYLFEEDNSYLEGGLDEAGTL